jgi:hypothetical protein
MNTRINGCIVTSDTHIKQHKWRGGLGKFALQIKPCFHIDIALNPQFTSIYWSKDDLTTISKSTINYLATLNLAN